MNANEIFRKRIIELREEMGIGVNKCAEKMGIGSSSLSQYENGKRKPNINVCKQFAEFFNTTCDYLVGLTDERGKCDGETKKP